MNTISVNINPLKTVLETHQEAFKLFETILTAENQKFNLTRITSPEQVHVRHFLDSLAGLEIMDVLSQELGKPLQILDAGSGAGFPGLALAIVRPRWAFVSLESTEKKVMFQKKVCDALKLKNVQVIHGRAEELAGQKNFREKFDAVTARALAELSILSELTLAFLQKEGFGVFWKGSSVSEELAKAGGAIQQMGCNLDKIARYTLLVENEKPAKFSLVVCKKISPTPKAYPRVFGVIKKNSLGNPA